jgi:hypothetical protein
MVGGSSLLKRGCLQKKSKVMRIWNIDEDKQLTVIQATYFIESNISIDAKWIRISQSFCGYKLIHQLTLKKKRNGPVSPIFPKFEGVPPAARSPIIPLPAGPATVP